MPHDVDFIANELAVEGVVTCLTLQGLPAGRGTRRAVASMRHIRDQLWNNQACWSISSMALQHEPSESRPNILFVFADQMRAMDMGCAGNPAVPTPAMDRLAREGVLCERHYAVCPICSPNRASMLTGTAPTTHRLVLNDTPMRVDLPSLGTRARDLGYRTAYIGKWHVDGGPRDRFIPPGPRRLGFDDYWAAWNCSHEYFNTRYHLQNSPVVQHREGYEPEIQTELALSFIDESAAAAAPFCLALSWGPPHNPYEEVPDQYREMIDPATIVLRPNVRPIPREVLDPAWSHPETTRDYLAQIASLDVMLGRLLKRLDDLGIADQTLVVFTSDHGEMMWSQGLLYKCVPFEEAVNIPLLIRYPRSVPAGRRNQSLIGSMDLLPTLATLAGWPAGPRLDGRDLSAALRGNAPKVDTPLLMANYGHYVFRPDFPVPEWRGLRDARYTLATTPGLAPWLMFDNLNDPFQMRNLADDPSVASDRDRLTAWLQQTLQTLGDPFLDTAAMNARFTLPQWP